MTKTIFFKKIFALGSHTNEQKARGYIFWTYSAALSDVCVRERERERESEFCTCKLLFAMPVSFYCVINILTNIKKTKIQAVHKRNRFA